ncbi:type VI secretion system protein TssA [Acinetobacter sp. SWAC5]|uniref:type VI secretion system protein TssA n=1 Tax=Acinetobacter sp. SWAC5 TaxID=2293835 RepID=UPI000E356AFE|nr:type VI secretion system protein TssA [Acinetobacter sp. SWAC5]RFS27730.1 type VI secretion system protein TssA [Acinetobacter sp. SWAC5]
MSVELETLLQPISEQQPCGTDYSFSNEFHAIKKAKTQDDPLLDQGDWVAEPKQADWSFVQSQTIELLTEKSKDIRLYTWLMEAWAHLYGFDGLHKSLALMQQSLNSYWFQLFPEIEDEDLDQRLGLLQGFINLLPTLCKSIPVVNVSPYYTLSDYESFLHQQNQKRKLNTEDEDQENPVNLMEQFDHALFNTSKSIQYQNYQAFLETLTQWQLLKDTMDQLMGLDAPSFAGIDSQIESIHLNLKKIYKAEAFLQSTEQNKSSPSPPIDTPMNVTTPHVEQATNMHVEHSTTTFQPQQKSHLANRDQAMRLLQEISDYFQVNEPHSPVSYMLQKTIKWGQMPLHEWLTQVIKNENPLENVQEMLGVQNNDAHNDW